MEAASPDALADCDVVVDALFGAGLDREVEGLARTMIEAINDAATQRGIPVIAVDLPSGINGTTGAVMGVAVQASRTVTFFRRKPGHLLLPGRLHCGPVEVADIGIPASVLAAIKPASFRQRPRAVGRPFPMPEPAGHKYARGHAVMLLGRPGEHRGGPAGGAWRAAGRGRAGDDRQPARGADGQCCRQLGGNGASGRHRRGAGRLPRRQAA